MVWSAIASLWSGRKAAKDASRAANISAGVQREGLEYLKESEAVPMFYRDQALGALASEYGLSPYTGSVDGEVIEGEIMPAGRPSAIDLAKQSPIYEAMLASRGAGEEALTRGASAAGRLRGGATLSDLADYNTELENQALLTSYQNVMQGLQGLSQQQGYAPQIAQQYSNIGQTLGAGGIAAARAKQEGYAGAIQGLTNLGKTALTAGASGVI